MPLIETGIIVSSDRAYNGQYEDLCGPAVKRWIGEREYLAVGRCTVVPDEVDVLVSVISRDIMDHDVVIIAGGTGLGPRDRTPQAIERLADYSISGIGELLRRESEKFSKNSYLSRCGGWAARGKLILAIPGNPKAAVEQLTILDDLLPHIVMSMRGECKHRRRVEE